MLLEAIRGLGAEAKRRATVGLLRRVKLAEGEDAAVANFGGGANSGG